MLSTVLSILLSIFTPPVDYEISLAGNFGEPRPHHFHGGIDVKTEGREGKHIYSIGDGYVSRITVGKDGFGNAIYITHPSGQTSVYCHLKAFSLRIKAALRKYQYQHQTCEADARLTPLDVPVSQGQFIALSGNTGHSTAPHLHLEVHDTRTWNMLDPYQFMNDFIQDTVAPQAHAFMAIPQRGGVFNGSSLKKSFSRSNELTAWGRVGFAVWADDYMQGSYNHYGIHETLLYVDGKTVFHSVVSKTTPAKTAIHSPTTTCTSRLIATTASHTKNPEYNINGEIADRKAIEGPNGITSGFRKGIIQGCSIIVVDLDTKYKPKTLCAKDLAGKLKGRHVDFEKGVITKCYFTYKGKSVCIYPEDVALGKEHLISILQKMQE